MQTHTAQTNVDDILEIFHADELLDYDEQEDLEFYELYDNQKDAMPSSNLPDTASSTSRLNFEDSTFHSGCPGCLQSEEPSAQFHSLPKNVGDDEWEEYLDLLVAGSVDADMLEEGWDDHGNSNGNAARECVIAVFENTGNVASTASGHYETSPTVDIEPLDIKVR
ncbi:hypothetical protein C0991_010414 [Blastosporella zonata]|nr:hypothetical protein C0991_010414 [Blastosporella zonata]